MAYTQTLFAGLIILPLKQTAHRRVDSAHGVDAALTTATATAINGIHIHHHCSTSKDTPDINPSQVSVRHWASFFFFFLACLL